MKEGNRTTRFAIALIATVVAVAGAAAAEAKKPANSSKLKTRSSAAVPANRPPAVEGNVATATATCPEKTNAVAGGFTASAPFIPNAWADATTWVNIFESQMVGDDSWRVSAKQFVQNGIGSIVAHVYCQRRKNPLKVGIASVPMPTAMNAAASATATCPSGKALSGGFLTPAPTDPNMGFVWSSFRSGADTWTGNATTFAGNPGALTAYVYCGGARRITEHAAATAVTGPGGSLFTARPEDCPKKNKPFSGGFSAAQPPMGLQSTALIYDSRRDGKSWIASAGPSNANTSSSIASYAYCRRR